MSKWAAFTDAIPLLCLIISKKLPRSGHVEVVQRQRRVLLKFAVLSAHSLSTLQSLKNNGLQGTAMATRFMQLFLHMGFQ